MAGDWIKLRKVIPDDPRTAEVARKCRRSRGAVVGALVALWCYGDDYAIEQDDGNGFIPYLTAEDIDRICSMEGFAEACPPDWLRLEDDGAYLPSFKRHNGDTAKKRAQKTARQTRYRAKQKRVDGAASTSAPTREEKRREESNKESSNEDSSASSADGTTPETGPSEFWFPTTSGTWHLPLLKLGEYQATYSSRLDVAGELRKARQWLIDNKTRRKTKRGMKSFLTSWLNRAYDRGGSPPLSDSPETTAVN